MLQFGNLVIFKNPVWLPLILGHAAIHLPKPIYHFSQLHFVHVIQTAVATTVSHNITEDTISIMNRPVSNIVCGIMHNFPLFVYTYRSKFVSDCVYIQV